jgi:hypothetical protein
MPRHTTRRDRPTDCIGCRKRTDPVSHLKTVNLGYRRLCEGGAPPIFFDPRHSSRLPDDSLGMLAMRVSPVPAAQSG